MAKQETIADIIAEMRNEGHTGPADALEWVREKMTYYADILEAAHKREVQDALDTGGYVEASRRAKQSGDGAKLREALCFLIENEHTLFWADLSNGELELLQQIVGKARAALAAPARNCDLYKTKEEAQEAFLGEACDNPCGNCWIEDINNECGVDWLFAPATEQKGEGDGNK